MRSLVRILILVAACAAVWSPAFAEKRVALVVGNAAYREQPLRNPVNDARAVAAALRETGFAVTLVENATKQALERAIGDFGAKLGPDSTALFYYAGHGIQARGQNYLVPVDAQIQSEARVRIEAVDADLAVEQMSAAGAKVSLVILDACRNNPFERRFRSGSEGGLAQVRAPAGTLVAYATAPGKVAVDGEGANSVYTGALVQALRQPGLAVEDVFKQVRVQVSRATQGQQVPWESSSLTGEFVFRAVLPAAASAVSPAVAPAAPVPRPVDDPAAVEEAFWDAAKRGSSEGTVKAYLDRYPQGRFAEDAKARLAALEPKRGRHDGRYSGALSCVAMGSASAFRWSMNMEIRDHEAFIDAYGNYPTRFAGTVLDGGRLVLNGAHTSGSAAGFTLRGSIESGKYSATGENTSGSWSRPCEMEMTRIGD